MNALPTPWALASVWTRLVGLPVVVSRAAPLQLRGDSQFALGVFGSRESSHVAAAIVEPALAASISAALPRIPAAVAKEAAMRTRLPSGLMENFHEIMNVTCQILHVPDGTRWPLKLTQAYQNRSPECHHLILAMRSTSAASWYVTVPGYGAGEIMIVDLQSI